MSAHPPTATDNKSPAPGISSRTSDLLVPIRGSNPLSSTDLSDLCSIVRYQTKDQFGVGVLVAFIHGG